MNSCKTVILPVSKSAINLFVKKAIFGHSCAYSIFLVKILIAVLTSIMAPTFTATSIATTITIGTTAYAAIRSVGIPPVVCCVAFLNLISNEGCIPPNAAPIYIATGISGLDNPVKIFKPLFLHFSLPVIIIAILIMLRIISVIGS